MEYALQHSKAGVGLILADIDHFKKVNDEHGHQQGDAVLRAVAEVLFAQSVQKGVTAYRYGGEELAVILTGVNDRSMTEFAESVRQKVEKLSFEKAPQLRVTISLGTASATNDGETPEGLLKNADSALYAAKHEGRNCVRSAS